MTDYPNAYTNAANDYATSHAPAGGYRPWSPRHSEFAAAFDAGCAHALATVTPRTISTAAELDALPVGQKVEDCDGDGYAKNKNGEWECSHVDHRRVWISEALAMYAPLTLLVPTTAAPEPVRLLDPEDPRIKPGARVRVVLEATVSADPWGELRSDWVSSHIKGTYKVTGGVYLLAEAPAAEDPRVEVLAEALHDRGGCEDEWLRCSPSTLGNYRDAARSLLPVLDAARADA